MTVTSDSFNGMVSILAPCWEAIDPIYMVAENDILNVPRNYLGLKRREIASQLNADKAEVNNECREPAKDFPSARPDQQANFIATFRQGIQGGVILVESRNQKQ